MKKNDFNPNFSKISLVDHNSIKADKLKTTDINILLNRVRISKKLEYRKKIFFLFLLLISTSSLGILFLLK